MDRLNIKELLDELKGISPTSSNNPEEPKTVCFDFGSAVPTTCDSYRGDFSQCALGYRLTGYDNDEHHFNDSTVQGLIDELEKTIGSTFDGWKGGEYTMTEDTQLWVSNPGNSDETVITSITDDGWRVIIHTRFEES